MKRYLFIVLFVGFLGCDDPKEEEVTPNEVTLWGVDYLISSTTVLSLNGLTGPIPPEIGNLKHLTSLSLKGNIGGPIPPEIGNLTNLKTLFLNDNQHTGSIPSEIGNLSNLEALELQENKLTGSIPPEIGNLTNLYTLYLNENLLTGVIPESICNLNFEQNGSYTFYFSFTDNKLCPPYPDCMKYWIGVQDTIGMGCE